ncbi:hypothetical protein [Flavobacterium wongokense]|uniref:hypothetical protein n=1 Tax=Flavobacterium wongokense TaxID=2910674 RepID=UPI001F4306E2|nr:hypothetical protein [Flavobacterium sp. WG47]MCF6131899.1 hypothetical protein [Flavobacterium sp. WG47]
MKKQILLPIIFAFLSIGCKKETPAPTPTEPVVEETAPAVSKTECYAYDANGSKIELELQTEGTEANGTLNYALAEKDKNGGTFTGKLENNILIADYHFQSEGVESTRQVAFKLEGDKLIEGYGEMTMDGTHFRDVSQIKFTSNMPLSKVDCTE